MQQGKMKNFIYCPLCKSKLKNTPDFFECKSCGHIIYRNSAPTASVLIIKSNKVLLAKRGIEPFKGKYDIIGGFLKYGEDPVTGALREVKEETGLKIKILDMLGIYMDTYGKEGEPTLNINYIGEIVSGKIKASDDVAELEWFPINKLPKPAFKGQIKTFMDLNKWFLSRGGRN
jgi:ADP-ribose pyrophosphatase YjhB (NUDIX family)